MEQLELFDVATHYPFELTEEFKIGYKSEEHVEYVYERGLPSEYGDMDSNTWTLCHEEV